MRSETMTQEITSLFVQMSASLGSIDSKLATVVDDMKLQRDKLADHETRIQSIEKTGNSSVKDNIVKWLVMALIGTVSVIVSLTGAGGILKQLMGNFNNNTPTPIVQQGGTTK